MTDSKPSLSRILKDSKFILLIYTSALALGFILQFLHPITAPDLTIPFKQLQTLINQPNVIVLDARNSAEFKQGHIPKAINLPPDQFDTLYPTLSERLKKQTLITYCSSLHCPNAQKLSTKLIQRGHNPVYTYLEGFEEWQAANLPTER